MIVTWSKKLLIKYSKHFGTMDLYDFQVKEIISNIPERGLNIIRNKPLQFTDIRMVLSLQDLSSYFREGTTVEQQRHFAAVAVFEYWERNGYSTDDPIFVIVIDHADENI